MAYTGCFRVAWKPPLAHERGGARHTVRLYKGSLLNQTVFPGSSACAIMEKQSGIRGTEARITSLLGP